jgi:cytochrome c5
MKRTFVLIFTIAAAVVCCKTVSLAPTAQDESIAKTKWADANLDQLNAGYKLYTDNCGRCHKLHKPTEYDETRWTKIVPWMGKKAELKETDQQLILHYLLAKRESLQQKK